MELSSWQMTEWKNIREVMHLIIALNKENEFWGNSNHASERLEWYDENFKALKKLSEDREISLVYRVVESTVKMTIVVKEIYRFPLININIPT